LLQTEIIDANCDQPDNRGRRRLLRASLLGCAALAVAPWSRLLAGSERRLAFHNLHTGENLDLPYWGVDGYLDDALTEINRVLRDHRSGEVYPIDHQLLDQLTVLKQTVGSSRPFHVISGYRSPSTNAKLRQGSNGVAKRSLHMQGRAIDVRLPGVALNDLHRAAKDLRLGGVGLYSRSDFIHLDTGRVRYW
jgi:uncharacterized protein YcbK (DUF882 family)